MSEIEEELFFFIADISGYTSFMLKNQMDYAHGTLIVTHLIKALIKEIELPLEISKLEGDAIFFYLRNSRIPHEFHNNPQLLGKKILQLFSGFSNKINELENSVTCQCGGCSHIHELQLKIIVHFGKATIDQIETFQELSGVSVILAHRLLKNEIKEKCYLLMTEPAFQRLQLPSEGKIVKREEHDKDLGEIPVVVYYPISRELADKTKGSSFLERTKTHALLILGDFFLKHGWKKAPAFHNFPEPPK